MDKDIAVLTKEKKRKKKSTYFPEICIQDFNQ